MICKTLGRAAKAFDGMKSVARIIGTQGTRLDSEHLQPFQTQPEQPKKKILRAKELVLQGIKMALAGEGGSSRWLIHAEEDSSA